MSAAPVILAALLGSCSSGSNESGDAATGPTPADPVARFQELARLKGTATFHVVYKLKTGYDVDDEEFAWLQDGTRVRWDHVNTRKGHMAGTSSIDDGAGGGLTCDWVTLDGGKTADVMCSPGAQGWGLKLFMGRALDGFFLFPWFADYMEFGGYRQVLGVEAECFDTNRRDFGGHICFSSEGAPLEIESEARTGSQVDRYLFTAIEIRPSPTEAELLTPVMPGA